MQLRKGKRSMYPSHLFARSVKVIVLGVIVLSALFALNQIKPSDYFPIKTVRVYGIHHADQSEIQTILTPLVSSGFFTINVEYIRDRLVLMPWVSDIFVRRGWPDLVEITVIEKKPAARWNNERLLSDAGELFAPKEESYPSGLPVFVGPEGSQMSMLDYYRQINRILSPLHVKISCLEMTPFATWKVALDNGISLQVGHKDILTRLDHFVKVYPKIVGEHADDVEYIDLRYPNGLAVRWKSQHITA